MAASLLALGLDPERCTLFVQSHRPEHTELAWLLCTVTPVSWLERTPTYKEKKQNQPDDINHGLLTYPVLQAADIIIYKASLVPVGRDQAAHLELSREIVRAFNARYGDTFPEPQAVFTDAPIVLGTDGVRKMSKSVGNTIDILGRARGRSGSRSCRWSPTRSGSCGPTRAGPRSATSASSTATSATTTRRSGTASGPPGPAASTRRSCSPTGSSPTTPSRASDTLELMADPGWIDEILADGAERLRPKAEATMDEVRQRMGSAMTDNGDEEQGREDDDRHAPPADADHPAAGAPVRHPARPRHGRARDRRHRDGRQDLLRLRRRHPEFFLAWLIAFILSPIVRWIIDHVPAPAARGRRRHRLSAALHRDDRGDRVHRPDPGHRDLRVHRLPPPADARTCPSILAPLPVVAQPVRLRPGRPRRHRRADPRPTSANRRPDSSDRSSRSRWPASARSGRR